MIASVEILNSLPYLVVSSFEAHSSNLLTERSSGEAYFKELVHVLRVVQDVTKKLS